MTLVYERAPLLPWSRTADAQSLAARLQDPLLVGEFGGDLPDGFDLKNSPATLGRDDQGPPAVLVSSSGTRLSMRGGLSGGRVRACLATCRRRLDPRRRHTRVALVGAGTKGEFRREDQLGCAWIGRRLLEAGYAAADE